MEAHSSGDSNPAAIAVRRALYGGIGGVCGATGGWLTWVALQSLREHFVEILTSICIGAGLSVLINKFIEPYFHVAHQERHSTRAVGHPLRLATLFVVFLCVAMEHLASHIIHEVRLPFLMSVAMMFPAGAIFGVCFPKRQSLLESSILWNAIRGALMGAAVGLVTMVVRLPIDLRAAVPTPIQFGSLGWWTLMGMCFGIAYGETRRGTAGPIARPILGALLALAIVLLLSLPGIRRHMPEKVPAIFAPLTWITNAAVDQMLSAPELPASFWQDAERALDAPNDQEANQKDRDPNDHEQNHSQWGTTLARWLGCEPQGESQASSELLRDPVGVARSRKLGQELEKGFASGFIRSWVVMLLFSVGIWLGSVAEWAYLPHDYANSQTRKNDSRFFSGMIAMTVIAMMIVAVDWPGPWKQFDLPDGSAKVTAPGTPKDQTIPLPYGQKQISLHAYTADLPASGAAFRIAYLDYPPDLTLPGPDTILNQDADQTVSGLAGHLVGPIKTIELGGNPGREFRFESSIRGGQAVYVFREFLVGTRMYVLMVVLPKKHAESAAVNQFLDSFKLTDKQPAPNSSGLRIEPSAWKSFAPAGGNCRLLMPGTPKTYPPIALEPMKLQRFVAVVGDPPVAEFSLVYGDYPPWVTVPDLRSNLARKELMANFEGKVISVSDIRLGDYQGIEVRGERVKRGRELAIRMRYFLVERRLYTLAVAVDKKYADAPEMNIFFDSFAVTHAGSQ